MAPGWGLHPTPVMVAISKTLSLSTEWVTATLSLDQIYPSLTSLPGRLVDGQKTCFWPRKREGGEYTATACTAVTRDSLDLLWLFPGQN